MFRYTGYILFTALASVMGISNLVNYSVIYDEITINATTYDDTKGLFQCGISQFEEPFTTAQDGDSWLSYNIDIPTAGRYSIAFEVSSKSENAACWLEDYIDNSDGRTYNVTGLIPIPKSEYDSIFNWVLVDGSPLDKGIHKMKFHFANAGFSIKNLRFTLLKKHQSSQNIFKQKMDGKEWTLKWSDEFDGAGLPDTNKWAFDIGNWGWGNYEKQYYTEYDTNNAKQDNGNLIIRAVKNNTTQQWTSARLTTRGKESFLYGKIDIRAKVPTGDGAWTAAWMLGDAYTDEISWPYCGEIDIIECTGHEIDDSGKGRNHMSFHTGAYYFKKGNQVKGIIPLDNMDTEYHIYTIEWYPGKIHAFVDGKKVCTYDKNANELEWPFGKPQNIVLNIAMGGYMGGNIDPNVLQQEFIIDYIRVSELND